MIKLNGQIVKPTIFPDKTSQVWNLDTDLLINALDKTIEWSFEEEAELIHIVQLAQLCIKTQYSTSLPTLEMTYLPYGRQDKSITNTSTFALKSFLALLGGVKHLFEKIVVTDAHNPSALPEFIQNQIPQHKIISILKESKADIVCFPDSGAANRGYYTLDLPEFSLDKKRNQETGEIDGLTCKLPLDLRDKTVIIVDDICDGGKTFIEAAKLLYNMGASSVHLYTTHGLYTKGIDCLREAGIKRIFNVNGEV